MIATIAIPQMNPNDCRDGTTGVKCSCGGTIDWAEAAYAPGTRACRSCLAMYQVRGRGNDRRLVPQVVGEDHIEDAGPDAADEDIYRVPEDLYPGWYQPV